MTQTERAWRDAYFAALAAWKAAGGPRPAQRPDGFATRRDLQWMTPAELAICDAMLRVEKAGASPALTGAIVKLGEALGLVADHVEAA